MTGMDGGERRGREARNVTARRHVNIVLFFTLVPSSIFAVFFCLLQRGSFASPSLRLGSLFAAHQDLAATLLLSRGWDWDSTVGWLNSKSICVWAMKWLQEVKASSAATMRRLAFPVWSLDSRHVPPGSGLAPSSEKREHLKTEEPDVLLPSRVATRCVTKRLDFITCCAVAMFTLIVFLIANLTLDLNWPSVRAGLSWPSFRGILERSSETTRLGSIVPIPCHSHNDYWREKPVFSALNAGCVGIEADVWLRGSDLYVAHRSWSLRREHTFASLYVDPLVRLLEDMNAESSSDAAPRGVFDSNPAQTLVLLVDLKTEAANTWPQVVRQLEPLRQHDWLSFVADGKVTYRPITVVGTGNTDFELLVQNSTYRDYFFDASIDELRGSGHNPTNSYYTSKSFKDAIGRAWFGDLSESQLRKVREHVVEAHEHGLKMRYWSLPSWPAGVRNHIWGTLVREGVDIINVDDVDDAKELWAANGWPTLVKQGFREESLGGMKTPIMDDTLPWI